MFRVLVAAKSAASFNSRSYNIYMDLYVFIYFSAWEVIQKGVVETLLRVSLTSGLMRYNLIRGSSNLAACS